MGKALQCRVATHCQWVGASSPPAENDAFLLKWCLCYMRVRYVPVNKKSSWDPHKGTSLNSTWLLCDSCIIVPIVVGLTYSSSTFDYSLC